MGLIPNRYFELTHTVVEHVDEALGKYIRGTMLECLLVGLTLIIGFYLCGIEFKIAFMIGAIGGLTNAIPFVGTFIACIIGAVYSLIAENIDPLLPFVNENNLMIAVIAVVMIAHLLDNAIFQPLVVGSAVNLHPLVVILGVFGGSLMFGFAGLIFAIPTIVVLKVVTETFFTGLKDYRII
jgi:predicted PurR-regulated permease PerM